MRRYQLTVNGQAYTVDVEELGGDRFAVRLDERDFEVTLSAEGELQAVTPAAAPVAPVTLPTGAGPGAPLTPVAAPPPAAAPVSDAGGLIRAPMPGTILSIAAPVGTRVQRGQAVVVLEAMKMNNSIGAPRDGVVAAILVQPGQSVGYGEVLAQLE
jgi:glutaconyl-CoA/methylmalonyl-CoA decarboxylase subunit gamma